MVIRTRNITPKIPKIIGTTKFGVLLEYYTQDGEFMPIHCSAKTWHELTTKGKQPIPYFARNS